MSKSEDVRIFKVKGYRGPMTLAFRYLGRHQYAPTTISDIEARELNLGEVQEWYEAHGWPARGQMTTSTKRGNYKGLWEMCP